MVTALIPYSDNCVYFHLIPFTVTLNPLLLKLIYETTKTKQETT